MKRILIALALLVTSCSQMDANQPNKSTNPEVIPLDNTSDTYTQQYKIYTLEGCEYIVVGLGDWKWGSHKGNCKNPIHKTK
jgi:hypothetical protein